MSSWVDSGFEAQSVTSAPEATSVRMRFAVSVVTCMQAPMRTPSRGRSSAKRSRMRASTGMSRSAHRMRFWPSSAKLISRMSQAWLTDCFLSRDFGCDGRQGSTGRSGCGCAIGLAEKPYASLTYMEGVRRDCGEGGLFVSKRPQNSRSGPKTLFRENLEAIIQAFVHTRRARRTSKE